MARILVADSAHADAIAIFAYLGRVTGRPTLVKYLTLFENLYERLANHPTSGSPRRTLGSNIRIGVVAPYIVIYRYDEGDDTVRILRIVHGRRKISGQMLS